MLKEQETGLGFKFERSWNLEVILNVGSRLQACLMFLWLLWGYNNNKNKEGTRIRPWRTWWHKNKAKMMVKERCQGTKKLNYIKLEMVYQTGIGQAYKLYKRKQGEEGLYKIRQVMAKTLKENLLLGCKIWVQSTTKCLIMNGTFPSIQSSMSCILTVKKEQHAWMPQ